jgi:4'-phosphopantetheinyl transferase
LWTLKESYIKARGMGLAIPLDKFAFVFGGAEQVRLEVDESLNDREDRWQFCLLDHAGHRIAVMAERRAGYELKVWEAHPIPEPALRVSALTVVSAAEFVKALRAPDGVCFSSRKITPL